MSLPATILNKIYDHYQVTDWCIITLNEKNQIIHCNPKAKQDLQINIQGENIQSVLSLVATESLSEDFHIPFYNHNEKIFDVHFNIDEITNNKYLIMVPVDMVHKQVQYKQQMAHDQSIEMLRIQYLFNTLENAHNELNEANAAKSFYISALSHEIGNPLNVIKGYNQLLQEGSIATEQATQIINKNVNKLQQIINQTLDFNQQQTSKLNALFKPADLIDEQFKDFYLQAQNKNLKLINLIDTSVILTSNKTKWNQIFTNLISNAIKYTESGQITISSLIEENLLHIDVTDTGCGMSHAFQQKLFTAWSREKKSQSQGNGIGLVISKMLAEQLDATLILHSSDTQGSRFRFSFNYCKSQQSQRILLVDDDHDCLNLFNYYLTQAGHQVKTAHSIAGLKSQLRKHTFDTLITDLNLSDGQVHHAFSTIRNKVKTAIVMTAHPTADKVYELNQIGFDQVLSKPLNQEQLVNSVN